MFKINTLQAIVVNYCIAFIFGIGISTNGVSVSEIPTQSWFFGALFLGFIFITIFNVMAITAQRNGLSVASVAGKMSVVIPVIFGIFAYKESVGFVKIIGIILALIAVYLSSAKSDAKPVEFKNLIFPLLLFFGSGLLDAILKYVETMYVSKDSVPLFLATIFGIAFLLGSLFIVFQIIKGTFKFQFKNILGGLLLGIPNYYSMDFLVKALKTKGLESSTLFTLNNVSIVILTTVFGMVFFKEKLVKKNWIGIILAIISILLVSLA